TNNVNGIKNIESTTLQGVSVIKVYFQPDVNIELAIAQVVSSVNSIRAVMPPGIQPPIVLRYLASQVPVIQLSLSSTKESEQQIYDYAMYRVRQALVTSPGITIPAPSGGKSRQIMVDLDLAALAAHGMTPEDVTNAVTAQNVTVPSGLVKMGDRQLVVRLNANPDLVQTLNDIPITAANGRTVLLRDVAWVRDGYQVQQNIVRAEGSRSVLMTLLKNGNASTLTVVNNVKAALPTIRAAAPKDMKIEPLFDQSVFVSSAISDVLREGLIAAGLTGLMILLFLGSWRATIVVLVSIPLSVLASLAVLGALGQTINLSTLGGLALAVGILVDDATVAIENTYRLLEHGKPFRQAVVEGAAGIAKPALISTLAICSAFVAVFFLTDAAKYLFTPQAMAVVFAMLASYLLSRTLVPILIDVLVGKAPAVKDEHTPPKGLFGRFHAHFEHGFTRFQQGYENLLRLTLAHRIVTACVAGGVLALGAVLYLFVGTDYYPRIDAGQMTLHVRAYPGTRIEEAERLFQSVEDTIREVVPDRDRGLILDNIGLPSINYNLAYGDGSFVAYYDGQILVSLKEGHAPASNYMRVLRRVLRERFPNATFYFQPADIITQVLNFGIPAPIDIKVTGRDPKNRRLAEEIEAKVARVRGTEDVHVHQILNAPEFFVDVDRQRALDLGLTEQQIATNLNISLSSSFQVTPNFWSDPKSGIPYQVAVQTPEYRTDSFQMLENTPMLGNASVGSASLLSNVASIRRTSEQTVATHTNAAPTYDVFANVANRDLGSVQADLQKIVDEVSKELTPGNTITIRGQIESKDSAFSSIGLGLIAALVFVYLLMAVNFQSWGDPFVVLAALPLAFCGIVISLFITGTSFSIPSLLGAIMSVGVASANSILLVTFAREHREQTGVSATEAAIEAGLERLRPVLMTAGAMFVGLIPMSLGLGDGSEQNAALARAVMGGIAVGTCSTLLFVPFLYSLLRRGEAKPPADYLGSES
ncbi:MAG: efflux RND transporter permease subunit, partial [Acetobacteraceae bacterium]|nr:efflux RND transporter permease subunit [Acetobacteraceae bacterium]